jgi:GAF domain-containing protein
VSKTITRLRHLLGPPSRALAVAIFVTVLATLATPPLVALLTDDRLQAWIATLIASAALLVGLILGTAIDTADEQEALGAKISELESRTGELGAYETYAEHLRDALRDLRQVLARELPNFSTRDFVETGVFAPAHALLQHDHRNRTRGDVRFSILRQEGNDFVMTDGDELAPALGHQAESRQRFRLPIRGSFAGIALDHARVQWSNDLDRDTRFHPHPKASPERGYRSIVSVPLWRSGEIAGVLNVIATRIDAFSPIDRTYITLLASVIDVAESVRQPPA